MTPLSALDELVEQFRRIEGEAVELRFKQGQIVLAAQRAGTPILRFAALVGKHESTLRALALMASSFDSPVPGASAAAHAAAANAGKDRAWLLARVEEHGGRITTERVRELVGRAPVMKRPIVRIVPPSAPAETVVPMTRTPPSRVVPASPAALFLAPERAPESPQGAVAARSRYWEARTCASGALSRLQSLRALLPDLAMADEERDALAGVLTGILTEAAALWRELRADGALDAALRDLTEGS